MSDYFDWKRSTVAKTSFPHYERWVKRYEAFRTGPHSLKQVSAFKDQLIEDGYAPRNIQYGLSIVRDYLSYRVVAEGLDFPIKLFRIKQERSVSHVPISRQDYQKMLKLLPQNEPMTLQRRLMLSLLWDTGMRVGELVSLRVSDLSDRHATIENEKNHRSRLIAWTHSTDLLLKRYLPLREALPHPIRIKNGKRFREDYLFVSFRYRPTRQLTTRQVQRIIRDLRREAGLTESYSPHSFRHGFVHRRLEEGKPITTVAQMLGHSTAMNVMNYAKLTGKEIQEAWGL